MSSTTVGPGGVEVGGEDGEEWRTELRRAGRRGGGSNPSLFVCGSKKEMGERSKQRNIFLQHGPMIARESDQRQRSRQGKRPTRERIKFWN